MASKNNHGSLHPCSRSVSGFWDSKFNNSDFIQLRMQTISIRNNELNYLTLFRMNIPHEHNMFHICALRNMYIAVMYQHMHNIKYAYRRIFTYIFRSLLLPPSSGFLCKNADTTNHLPTLHNTAISQHPKLSLCTADIDCNI